MRPTELLKQEHRKIERCLHVLEHFVQRAERGESISPEIFRDILRFIRDFADGCHHGKEEALLFPAMEQKGFSRQYGPIAVMLFEHDEGRKFVKGMQESISRYESGDNTAIVTLSENARKFIELLRLHIQKEDHVLFMMADAHLNDDEQEDLKVKFQRIEETGDSCRSKIELMTLLEKLENLVYQHEATVS